MPIFRRHRDSQTDDNEHLAWLSSLSVEQPRSTKDTQDTEVSADLSPTMSIQVVPAVPLQDTLAPNIDLAPVVPYNNIVGTWVEHQPQGPPTESVPFSTNTEHHCAIMLWVDDTHYVLSIGTTAAKSVVLPMTSDADDHLRDVGWRRASTWSWVSDYLCCDIVLDQ